MLALAALAAAALTMPAGAGAHAERATFFPDPDAADFPGIRSTGPALVVCADDSKQRIKQFHGKIRARQQRLLKDCEYDSIQAAVNDAQNNMRILVLPGVYEELGSRGPAPAGCEDVYERTENGQFALTYEEHRQCPNAQNLIAILGDTNGDRICDSKCNIQIEGVAPSPDAVQLQGERAKLNVIRADRADGVILRNFTVEFSDFNNIYVLETNGFRIDRVVSGYSREYGILSFTSDHGIYENCETYGNGDSGVY
ncbi:MAG: right-handed parallel beta-helix repeat-containing protein, partial [Solirubrobacterales bacterium]